MPAATLPPGVDAALRGPGPQSLARANAWLRDNSIGTTVTGQATRTTLAEFILFTTEPHPSRSAPITGRYDEPSIPWVGWIEDAARSWVAFVAKSPERFTLLWKEREAGGGVKGDPVCFLRDEDAERGHLPNAQEANPSWHDGADDSIDKATRTTKELPVTKTVKAHGATFAIDRAIGHVKKGKGFDGKPFELTYSCDYGYLQKTHEDKAPPIGGDGMMIDAYCCAPTSRAEGDDAPPSSVGDEPMIHVVNQVHPKTRAHDEQKLILNAKDPGHATAVYMAHTPAQCFGSMFTMTGDAFRTQLAAAAPGKRMAFAPMAPAPEEPAPSTKRGAGLTQDRGAIPTHAASAIVHAIPEPHQMPLPVATKTTTAHRDAGALNDEGVADLFTRVISATRAYTKDIDGQKRVCVDFVMSTEAKDNHGTILRAKWDLKRFNTNPVFLYMHNRREDRPPIGVMENVRVEGKSLLGTACLSNVSEFDREIAEKYLQKIMRGGSVGFNPRTITVEVIDGEETVVFDDNELLEFSAACVPSNPETLAKLTEQRARCLEIGRAAGITYPETRGAVPHRKYPLDQSPKWDEKAAEKAVRAWATTNGKINFAKYAQAFGWVDPDKSDSYDGYKLLHHSVSPDGKSLVTVRGGVIAAGNAIQGARGGLKIPPADLPSVKAHLGEHYKEFGLAPPWEKKKAHDPSLPTPTEISPMHTIVLRLLDTAPDTTTPPGSRAHGVQPCEVTCPGCSETLRVTPELPESVALTSRALTETRLTLDAAEKRAAVLETKLGVRSADVSKLLIDLATRDLADLTGKQIDPTEVETELELARNYFADETRDDKGNLVGLAKWQARVAKIKARPDQKLGQRTVPAPKAGDVPTQPAAGAGEKKDNEGRTVAGTGSLSRISALAKSSS